MEIPTTIELPADAKQQLERLKELYGKEEPLCDELVACLYNDRGFPYLNHPLVCTPFVFPHDYARMNEGLRQKRAWLEEAIAEGKWRTAIGVYIEKPFRLEYLLMYKRQIPKEEYWPLLRDIWAGVENLWQYKHAIGILLEGRANGTIREMFDDEEWQEWEKFPPILTAYRGCQPKNRKGWSWTLDKGKAIWFARRFWNKQPILRQVEIPREKVIFYTDSRGEQEVVINPEIARQFKVKEQRL